MDREFPSVLFPSFYTNEPPDTEPSHCAGSWGSYGQIRLGSAQPSGSYSLKVQREISEEVWCHTEPAPVPLFSPKNAVLWPSEPADPLDFSEHVQNFFRDYSSEVFGSMASLIGEDMCSQEPPETEATLVEQKAKNKKTMTRVINNFKSKKANVRSRPLLDAYSCLLSDSVHSVPVELLSSLLHEEIELQSLEATFSEANTGGALEFIPFTSSTEGAPQSGCLVYCANGVDKLCFQQVALQPRAVVCSGEASTVFLKGPIHQISSSSTCGHNCVAVRSMYRCGVWSVSSSQQPHLLQAMSTAERVCCVGVSPHVVGEVIVASESGAAHLWRLGHGMQLVRTEDSNLYFNGQSPWRWCEFSAHPRVILYADRTGAELTDFRVKPSSSHTLFRISKAAECRSGERVLLSRYLSSHHSFHHLLTTQYSAYLMDERFPCVPMLKWDHLMDSPPIFCHVLPGSEASAGAKVLLGSQHGQEITLLQYSGGGTEACVSHGPPQTLLRPRDSMDHLPLQVPHRTKASHIRLSHPATGMTAVQLKRSTPDESICVFQILQSGDIFYQTLEKDRPKSDTNHALRNEQLCSRSHQAPNRRLSEQSTSIWKRWLQTLAQNHKTTEANSQIVTCQLGHFKTLPKSVFRVKKVQRALKLSMCPQALQVCSTEVIQPLVVDVQAEDWSDALSSRLTAGWEGKEAWHSWWSEHLGTNTAEKIQALKRKRRREKDSKRVSGLPLLARAGSFTSSVSYQSDLSDWVLSDGGGARSQHEDMLTQDTPTQEILTQDDEQRPLTPPLAETERAVKPRPSTALVSKKTPAKHWTLPVQSQGSRSPEPSLATTSTFSPRSVYTAKSVASSQDTFLRSQSSQRLSQSSKPRKKSRMGF